MTNLEQPFRSCSAPALRLLPTALAALPLLVLSGCGATGKDPAAGMRTGAPMAVQVHVLAPAALANTLASSGTLLANESVEVRSEVSGRVSSINFKEGGPVQAGQVLVRINDDDLRAQLRKAQAELQLAEITEQRQEQLLAVKGLSQEAFDATHAQRISKQADVDNLRALIAKTVVRAPFSGLIGLRSISEGGYVAPSTAIATLTQVQPMKLDFDVPERHGRQIMQGQDVQFTLVGDTVRYTATIYAVEPGVNPDTRSVRVRARANNAHARLAPGAFARVFMDLGTIADALTIPSEGVVPDIQGQVVMLIRDGKAKTVRVELGLRTEETVQLISGVQAGDTVITSGLLAVREGMPVVAARQKSNDGADATSTDKPGAR
ncbi:MAG: efflux RND transporter periplasmic adaptor subunit [Flavobacteriales bacterium]|nr:efflux RND transporter periplasmic adaptor subunit [Flavobacteriales bacterium]MBP9079199.1 efflux RND transporter periplasmic adaptor subunit [Flavobacteriales bacterium]